MQSEATPAASSFWHRIRSSLLLAACADGLADPTHGNRLPTSAELDDATHPLQYHPAGRGSHLGAHILTLAEHLAAHAGGLDENSLSRTLAQLPATDTRHGGRGTTHVLSQIAQGIPWWQAAHTIHNGTGSHGSTAAARAVAVGLLPHLGVSSIAELARRTAVITHTHPIAGAAAAVVACAVTLAAHGLPRGTFSTERFLAALAHQAHHPEFDHYLHVTRTLTRHRAGPAETTATLNSTSNALNTVHAALTAYLRHRDEPTAAIRYALALGNHTHATATITAALVGACRPAFQPPPSWRTGINQAHIHAVATNLADLKTPHSQPWRPE